MQYNTRTIVIHTVGTRTLDNRPDCCEELKDRKWRGAYKAGSECDDLLIAFVFEYIARCWKICMPFSCEANNLCDS